MPNWGDKLYPGTTASLLSELGVSAEISAFCPVPGQTSSGAPIKTLDAVRDSNADVALAGGGDILRFDKRTVAMDHLSVPTERRGSRVNRVRARVFAHRHFLPGAGPWAPAEPWISTGPSILISAGVHTVPETPEARRAVSNYRAAWVRTENGAERLAGAGVAAERIVVAPDMIFALPDYADSERVRRRGIELFERRAHLSDAPLVFQAAEFHGWPLERVVAVLERLRGLPVVLMSLGSYAGEDRLLRAAGRRVGLPVFDDLAADDITAVLAGAGAVFSTSMHAAIVGASFGTPVLVPGVGKTRDAFAVVPLPPTLHGVDDTSLRETTESLLGTRSTHDVEPNRAEVVRAFRRALEAGGVL